MTRIDQSTFAHRRSRAAELVAAHKLGGLVVGTGPEFAYLTGSWASSHERLTALAIGPDGRVVLVAPVTDIGSLGVAGDDVEIRGWQDGQDPYQLATEALDASGPVALGSSLTANHVFALQALLPQTRLATDTLAELFMAKEPAELAELKRAGEAIDRVHARVPEFLVAGRTEAQVAAELDRLIMDEHESVDFVIVGSGENGANPHHDFSERVLEDGDVVVVDLGGTLDSGYHSDCTRTYIVGGDPAKADPEVVKAYEVLFRAHQAAVTAARPGITAGELDAVARGVIEEAGYGEYFTHRLGHGIGLAGHEDPFIIAGNDTALQANMAFSIEPGIYLPGKWGMRLEDIVYLDEDGAVSLDNVSRDLR